MGNFKNIDFIGMVVASACFILFIMGRLGWTGFSAKMTYVFGFIAFGILSTFALGAILSRSRKNSRMKKKFLFVILTLLPIKFSAQVLISGYIKHQGTPLSDVNVMIENKSIGTYSDQHGKFSLPVNLDDKVIFSLIGYEKKIYLARDLSGNIEIQLKEQTYSLPEIEVSLTDPKSKGKKEEYGFIREKREIYNGRPIGNQVAVFIPHPNQENVLLTQALFRLAIFLKNEEKKCGKVRVHLYEFDQYTRSPGKDLLKKEVTRIICADQLIKVDVSEFKIAFPPEGIFVALEFLGETAKNGSFHLGKYNVQPYFFTTTNPKLSRNTWERHWAGEWKLHKKENALFGLNVIYYE